MSESWIDLSLSTEAKDYTKPTVYGVGFTGLPGMSSQYPVAYGIWKGMLRRGYSKKYKKSHPTYKNVSVDPRWHDFREFLQFFSENYKDGYALDKDLLVRNNNMYGPDKCIFISPQLNNYIHDGRGWHFNKKIGRYSAQIQVEGKKYHLGYFDDEPSASSAYYHAKSRHMLSLSEDHENRTIKKRLKELSRFYGKLS